MTFLIDLNFTLKFTLPLIIKIYGVPIEICVPGILAHIFNVRKISGYLGIEASLVHGLL